MLPVYIELVSPLRDCIVSFVILRPIGAGAWPNVQRRRCARSKPAGRGRAGFLERTPPARAFLLVPALFKQSYTVVIWNHAHRAWCCANAPGSAQNAVAHPAQGKGHA